MRNSTEVNLLAIETSSPVLSLAVKKGAGKIRQATVQGYMKHAENLIPVIDRLLKKEKLKIGDIGTFLIDRGPGSFTGLRIGFSTLKGFLAIRKKPCYGAFSTDILAAGTPPLNHRTLAVCMNAKRDKLYARSYRYDNNKWKALGAPFAIAPEAWIETLTEKMLVAGDGLELCARLLPVGMRPSKKKRRCPRASDLIALYERKDPLLKRLEKPKELLPFYLRASEAEERLKHGRKQ